MKFLVPNYSCLQNPMNRGLRPQIPVLSVLCPQLSLLNPPRKKNPGYATATNDRPQHEFSCLCLMVDMNKPKHVAL